MTVMMVVQVQSVVDVREKKKLRVQRGPDREGECATKSEVR